MRTSSAFRGLLRVAALTACGVLLQGCSAVKLAYNQVPNLAYWQLNSYLDLSDAQTERVRDELRDLHQWHRNTMLPQHAELLQKVQQQLPSNISPDQACQSFAEARTQWDTVLTHTEPKLAWLASQLSPSQIRSLQKKQAKTNADWKEEWVDVTPEKLRDHRFEKLLERTESFYGPLQAPQQAALKAFIAQSSFDPQRTYAERLRRQQDLVQVVQKIAQNPADSEQSRTLVRSYVARFNTSPDAAFQRYTQTLIKEGCEGFSLVHNTMTPAQRQKAVQSVQAYAQDFLVLAAQ